MIFYRFIVFIIIAFGLYIIYKVAHDAWKKSSVEDKLDEIELEKELHEQIDGIDEDEINNNKKDIDDFLKS